MFFFRRQRSQTFTSDEKLWTCRCQNRSHQRFWHLQVNSFSSLVKVDFFVFWKKHSQNHDQQKCKQWSAASGLGPHDDSRNRNESILGTTALLLLLWLCVCLLLWLCLFLLLFPVSSPSWAKQAERAHKTHDCMNSISRLVKELATNVQLTPPSLRLRRCSSRWRTTAWRFMHISIFEHTPLNSKTVELTSTKTWKTKKSVLSLMLKPSRWRWTERERDLLKLPQPSPGKNEPTTKNKSWTNKPKLEQPSLARTTNQNLDNQVLAKTKTKTWTINWTIIQQTKTWTTKSWEKTQEPKLGQPSLGKKHEPKLGKPSLGKQNVNQNSDNQVLENTT